MFWLQEVGKALALSFNMFWEVLWPLALGFLLSAVVQTVVSKAAVAKALGRDDGPSFFRALGFGAASSSCSYAAVAVGRGLFRKGASLSNAIIFEFASTNLVFELGLILFVLLGWQFVGAEFAGGVLMTGILFFVFRATLRPEMLEEARAQAEKGLVGKMEGHGEMDMSITDGPFLRRLFSARAFTAISHYFFMDVASLYQDLILGFLIAGAFGAWVPDSFWRAFFLTDHPVLSQFWGPLVGPFISMISFVCSIGNVPLAAVLWNGGISFGGVIAFIFADLIILPIINIYRKYYGNRMAIYLLVVSYGAMAVSGFLIGELFNVTGLAPAHHTVKVLQSHPELNYTTYLNLAFLLFMAVLGYRFLRTGGPKMLRMMEATPEHKATMATDPVCGMTVDPATATERSTHQGAEYLFCSAGCRQEFESNPSRYAGAEPSLAHHD